jgi:aminoglycoside phosphotransferase (APT) family kinase protein
VTSPPGLDLDALGRFLAPLVGHLHGPLTGEVIPGGKSNLTYVVHDGDRRFVVRRPPLALVLPTAHDMSREYRVLDALRDTAIPVPPVLVLCTDVSVLGAPFYVMEWVDGHVIRNELPAEFAPTPETRRAMSEGLVDTLAELHAVARCDAGGPSGKPPRRASSPALRSCTAASRRRCRTSLPLGSHTVITGSTT